MAHLPLRTPDDDLLPVLRNASSEDLGILVDYIMKDWNQDLMSVPDFKRFNPRAEQKIFDGDHRVYVDDLAAEVQRYGGNTFSNAFRGGMGVPYAEILRDVAEHLKVNYNKNADVAAIETQLQLKVLEKAYEEMSSEERRTILEELGINVQNGIPSSLPVIALQGAIRLGGFTAFRLASIIASALAKVILGRALPFAFYTGLSQAMKVLAGPVGWAITAVWTLVDIAGPANRVLVPCVLHVAYLRQKAMIIACPQCGEPQRIGAKFCQSCGTPIAETADAGAA